AATRAGCRCRRSCSPPESPADAAGTPAEPAAASTGLLHRIRQLVDVVVKHFDVSRCWTVLFGERFDIKLAARLRAGRRRDLLDEARIVGVLEEINPDVLRLDLVDQLCHALRGGIALGGEPLR